MLKHMNPYNICITIKTNSILVDSSYHNGCDLSPEICNDVAHIIVYTWTIKKLCLYLIIAVIKALTQKFTEVGINLNFANIFLV